MIDSHTIEQKLKEPESPILEFKREWYWTDNTAKEEKSDKWGELIKDVVSITNGYIGFVGKERYLIIGFCESQNKTYNVDCNTIKELKDLRSFKKKLTQKLESYTSPAIVDYEINFINIDNSNLLIFKVQSPAHITEIDSELKTKTRVLDPGAVLVRKGQDSDSIRLANIREIDELKTEFSNYKNSPEYISLKRNKVKENNKKIRSIEKTVQLFIDKNSTCSLDIGYPLKHKDWSENIVFELYKMSMDFGGKREFLYLHESSSQKKTFGYLNKEKLISKHEQLIILTERPNNIKDIEKRKENIKLAFRSENVFFIDEFGYEYLYKDCLLNYEKYNLPVYVESLFEDSKNESKSAFDELKQWYTHEAVPLFVVKGHGGIGKTTLAKRFLDYIYDSNDETGILFIDSNEIIDDLARVADSNKKIDDIYDFYKAQIEKDDSDFNRFSRDLLQLSIDNGSLIIVLDGIDEVIARLGTKFDINYFLESICNSYSTDLEKAKILITCRDHFWESLRKDINIPEITLKPFSEKLAIDFFNQAFENNSSQTKKAMTLAERVAIKESENDHEDLIYIPYILDIIVYLIKEKNEIQTKKPSFFSDYINNELQDDFIVASVCKREVKKLNGLSLDDQIRFLMRISTSKRNIVSLYDVKSILSSIVGAEVNDGLVEKLKNHILLNCSDNKLYFRYDFFNSYFKILQISSYFNKKNIDLLDKSITKIISGYIKYDNSFTKAICKRVVFDEDLIIFCIETIEELQDKIKKEESNYENLLQSAVSSIIVFIICSLKYSKSHHFDINSRTELLEKIFGTETEIKGLCLINIFGYDNDKPTFNFKSKILVNCKFEKYEYFWDCPIDSETRFINSSFKSLEPRVGVRPKFYDDTFNNNCDIADIKDIISKRKDELDNQASKVEDYLVKFFKLFYQRGNFYPRKQEQVRSKVFSAKLLPELLKLKVVTEYIDPHKPKFKQYKISSKYKAIISYIEQGSPCIELEKLVSALTKQ
ncbi:MAG: ATP-binding protein [Cyanobacteria bacterium P01_A01_bin.83]